MKYNFITKFELGHPITASKYSARFLIVLPISAWLKSATFIWKILYLILVSSQKVLFFLCNKNSTQ